MLLELADGNPLALVELRGVDPRAGELQPVPLTHRLELAFAGRYAELSPAARLGVLAAALGCESIEDATRAVARALGGQPSGDWLGAAAAAGLIEPLQGGGLGFRHPLVRSAVASAADPLERAALLRALVDTIADPARTVWWRADLAAGTDPELAAELEQIGEAGLAAGDAALALRALQRAAELTETVRDAHRPPAPRSRRRRSRRRAPDRPRAHRSGGCRDRRSACACACRVDARTAAPR